MNYANTELHSSWFLSCFCPVWSPFDGGSIGDGVFTRLSFSWVEWKESIHYIILIRAGGETSIEGHLMQMEWKCKMGEIKWICFLTLMPRHQEVKDMWTKSYNVSKTLNLICKHPLRRSYHLELTDFDAEHAWITWGILLLFWLAFWYLAILFPCVCQAKWMSPIPLSLCYRCFASLACVSVSFVRMSHVSMAAQTRFSEGKTCDVWANMARCDGALFN